MVLVQLTLPQSIVKMRSPTAWFIHQTALRHPGVGDALEPGEQLLREETWRLGELK